jgi:hypothetical protein
LNVRLGLEMPVDLRIEVVESVLAQVCNSVCGSAGQESWAELLNVVEKEL